MVVLENERASKGKERKRKIIPEFNILVVVQIVRTYAFSNFSFKDFLVLHMETRYVYRKDIPDVKKSVESSGILLYL